MSVREVDWFNIKNELGETDWQGEFEGTSVDEKYNTIISTTLKIARKYVPPRKACYKATIPRERKIIMRKRSKLNSRIKLCKNDHDRRGMQDKVKRLEEQLKESHRNERARDETSAVKAIQKNYKYFFKYVKKQATVKAAIGPLVATDGEVISDPQQICQTLRSQYEKVFSQPKESHRIDDPEFFFNSTGQPPQLEDIDLQPKDIIEAIECSSADQFKRVLDRFLKSVPDQPKMPHYNIRALSNSIPDQLALMRADGNYITVSSIMDNPSAGLPTPVPSTGDGDER
ncbi:hypothetical protein Pmani_009655 [Petrolisthes manimaculis]|uniref:Uncharacterized protein n=1 Tax=Petrolisthes manimaculis TaxID=1843537 RepID=A0AAE1Q319_9EUCA|nr:hypothetical protein Pmani_009655 [Petrolisthes manimaculis]